jgi:DNA-binding CsgD family transcriptional regulator
MCHKFFKSDYYNEILKPLAARHIIGTVIHERNRALGELVIWRAPHERPFSLKDRQLLLCLAPYIAHGLNARPNNDQPYVDSGNHGLVVTSQDGEIQYASPHGRELLFWATHPQISLSTVKSQPPPAPPLLAELCKNLVSIFQGESQPAPVKYHINPWGRFCFRAYWLEDVQYSRNALIAVTIELHKPLSLTLFSRMQSYGLSPRQKEVCQLLARKYAYPRIAEQLNISAHTLIDYVRRIYEKLEVHSHEELLEKLGILTGPKMDPDAIQLLRRHEGN